MDSLSGIGVLEALKRAEGAARVCVITGCGGDMIAAARRAGAECAFTKPLCIEDLLALLCPAEVA